MRTSKDRYPLVKNLDSKSIDYGNGKVLYEAHNYTYIELHDIENKLTHFL